MTVLPRGGTSHWKSREGGWGDFCISVSVSMSMKRNVCLAFYTLHSAGHCSVLSNEVDVLNELVVFPACKQSSPNLYPVVAVGW